MKYLALGYFGLMICVSAIAGVEVAMHDYVIVVSEITSESERYAADELQTHLKLIFGEEIEIVDENKVTPSVKKCFYIGRTEFSKKLISDADFDSLGDEGYIITHDGSNVLIVGSAARGALYGVYDFLEGLGVRWLTPTFTHLVKAETFSLPRYRKVIPKMWFRDQLWNNNPDAMWFARMRLNGGFTRITSPKFGGIWREKDWHGDRHTFHGLIPSTLFEEHPEWFALKDGKRCKGSAHHVELCMTNVELRKYAAKAVCDWIAKSPDANIFWVTQSDGSRSWCSCEACLSERKKHGGVDRWSANLCSFLSEIGLEVKKRFPKVKIKTLGYSLASEPPTDMKLPDNVVVVLCGPGNWMVSDSPENGEFYNEKLAAWRRTGAEVQLWSYAGSNFGFWWPFPSWYFIGDNINAASNAGINAFFMQGTFGGFGSGMCEMNAYVTARMLWNPKRDVRDEIQEFTDLYYGAAGKYIRCYMEKYYSHIKTNQLGTHHGWGNASAWKKWVSPEIIRYADSCFAKAFDAVKDDAVVYKRVQAAHLPILWARIHLAMPKANEVVSADAQQAIFSDIDTFIKLMKENKFTMWREGVAFDPEKQLLDMAGVLMSNSKRFELKNETQKLEIIPSLGGRIVSWKVDGCEQNIFAESSSQIEGYPFAGGYEELEQFKLDSPAARTEYEVLSCSKDCIKLFAKLKNGIEVTRDIRLLTDGFRVQTTYCNVTQESIEIHLRSHPVLSFDACKESKCHIGKRIFDLWKIHEKFGELPFDAEDASGNYLILDNIFGSKKIKIGFDSRALEKVYIYWAKPESLLPVGVTVELWKAKQVLKPKQSVMLKQTFAID